MSGIQHSWYLTTNTTSTTNTNHIYTTYTTPTVAMSGVWYPDINIRKNIIYYSDQEAFLVSGSVKNSEWVQIHFTDQISPDKVGAYRNYLGIQTEQINNPSEYVNELKAKLL